jgi:hypothetical protein
MTHRQTNHTSGNSACHLYFQYFTVLPKPRDKDLVFWDKMLYHWATVFGVSKDFLAFIFRVTLKIKAA